MQQVHSTHAPPIWLRRPDQRSKPLLPLRPDHDPTTLADVVLCRCEVFLAAAVDLHRTNLGRVHVVDRRPNARAHDDAVDDDRGWAIRRLARAQYDPMVALLLDPEARALLEDVARPRDMLSRDRLGTEEEAEPCGNGLMLVEVRIFRP